MTRVKLYGKKIASVRKSRDGRVKFR